jgi:hypothetical protein
MTKITMILCYDQYFLSRMIHQEQWLTLTVRLKSGIYQKPAVTDKDAEGIVIHPIPKITREYPKRHPIHPRSTKEIRRHMR